MDEGYIAVDEYKERLESNCEGMTESMKFDEGRLQLLVGCCLM